MDAVGNHCKIRVVSSFPSAAVKCRRLFRVMSKKELICRQPLRKVDAIVIGVVITPYMIVTVKVSNDNVVTVKVEKVVRKSPSNRWWFID